MERIVGKPQYADTAYARSNDQSPDMDPQPWKYEMHCIVCGTTDRLGAIPHRVDLRMVGMIYACPVCRDRVFDSGCRLVLELEEPNDD